MQDAAIRECDGGSKAIYGPSISLVGSNVFVVLL
jgi:hypothetical protein